MLLRCSVGRRKQAWKKTCRNTNRNFKRRREKRHKLAREYERCNKSHFLLSVYKYVPILLFLSVATVNCFSFSQNTAYGNGVHWGSFPVIGTVLSQPKLRTSWPPSFSRPVLGFLDTPVTHISSKLCNLRLVFSAHLQTIYLLVFSPPMCSVENVFLPSSYYCYEHE